MNTKRSKNLITMLLVGALAVVMPQLAMAAGTAAGTEISNQASVAYTVGGNSQSPLYSCDDSACTQTTGGQAADLTKFNVDRKINFTVVTNGGDAKNVTPGEQNTAFGYRITNTGNTSVTFNLSRVIADTNGILTDEGTTRIFLDADQDGVKDAGEVTQYADATTFGDIAADGDLYITVVQNVEAAAANGNTAMVDSFTVVAKEATTGAALSEGGTAGSGSAIVFADSGYNNTETVGTNRVWTVNAPVLNVQKTQSLISDGTDGTTGFIPGAIVEYTIRVTYASGSGSATGVIISDNIPVTLAPLANQYDTDKEVTRRVVDITGATDVTSYLAAGDADLDSWGTAAGSDVAIDCNTTLNEANDYCEIKFRVTIQ